jgi:hypothetical protein
MTALTRSLEEAAELIGGVSAQQLAAQLRRRAIPGRKIARSWRMTDDDIQAVIDRSYQEPIRPPANAFGVAARSPRLPRTA